MYTSAILLTAVLAHQALAAPMPLINPEFGPGPVVHKSVTPLAPPHPTTTNHGGAFRNHRPVRTTVKGGHKPKATHHFTKPHPKFALPVHKSHGNPEPTVIPHLRIGTTIHDNSEPGDLVARDIVNPETANQGLNPASIEAAQAASSAAAAALTTAAAPAAASSTAAAAATDTAAAAPTAAAVNLPVAAPPTSTQPAPAATTTSSTGNNNENDNNKKGDGKKKKPSLKGIGKKIGSFFKGIGKNAGRIIGGVAEDE